MRFSLAIAMVLALVGFAPGQVAGGDVPERSDAAKAIDRGVAFLVKDALAWKSQYKCASCHHASLVIWSLNEAQRRGRPIDAAVLADLTKWIAESGDGKTGVPRPTAAPKALNTKAVYFALGLTANLSPDSATKKGLSRLLKTVEADQTANGSWIAWPETRPPFFGDSDESMTALATLALLPAAQEQDPAANTAVKKSVDWLAKIQNDDNPQSLALRLVLWRRLERPAVEWKPLLERLKKSQNSDGGWSQADGMSSDAWATGEALYALAYAGVGPSEPAVIRGQAFLVRTQRTDGSWPMTSRPTKPGGPGSSSLVPITGAGTAWAVIGLARSS
jgi:squalene-hopene cyclase-like protein